MNTLLYIAGFVAVMATLMTITRSNPVHALLYLIVSLLSVALVFFILGAPFIAALEIIIYAGAVMVLFVFVVIMLNTGRAAMEQEKQWLNPALWVGPASLSAVLLGELVYVFGSGDSVIKPVVMSTPAQVGAALLGPYLLGVELASMLLLAGLVAAFHLGRRESAVDGKEGSA